MTLVESGAQADTFVPLILSGVQNNLVSGPRDWASRPALHFWVSFTEFLMWTSSNEAWLGNYGWLLNQTAVVVLGGGDQDFLDETGFGGGFVRLGSDLDVITSPFLFGGMEHINFLFNFLSFKPRRLLMDCLVRFPDVHVSGVLPRMGFSVPARIVKNGDNFLVANTASNQIIATADGDKHIFRLRVEDRVYASMDGGSEVSVSLDTGIWPVGWSAQAGGDGGDVEIAWVHIWYE